MQRAFRQYAEGPSTQIRGLGVSKCCYSLKSFWSLAEPQMSPPPVKATQAELGPRGPLSPDGAMLNSNFPHHPYTNQGRNNIHEVILRAYCLFEARVVTI